MNKLSSNPVNSLKGIVNIPGDKSISHRSLILGALSIGITKIDGIAFSEDILNLIKTLKALGVKIIIKGKIIIVHGVGIGGLKKTKKLYMGNSGTATRLMMGVLSNQEFKVNISGDKSLSKRPMQRIIEPLTKMGAEIKSKNGKLPIIIKGVNETLPINYNLIIPSAQIKSSILLASLGTPGLTTIVENIPTRDHTEILLKLFGAKIQIKRKKNKNLILLKGQKELIAKNITISGDPSSASIVGAAALITPNSEIKIKNVNINKTRSTFFNVLKKMNANIHISKKGCVSNEEIADITFKSSQLKGVHLEKKTVSGMIDEIPIFSIIAAFASSNSSFSGGEELKYKESNRIDSIYSGLLKCKVKVKKKLNGLSIISNKNKPYGGSTIQTNFDHRIAMSFLIMGIASVKKIKINESNCIKTSFPDFVNLINNLGAKIS